MANAATIHLRQHRQAKGPHALELLFPAGRRLVSRAGRRGQLQPDREINLTPLPMFHMNALGCSQSDDGARRAVVPLDRFHANRWWQCVADSGATVVHCLGVIPAILLQLPVTEVERQHRVRFAFAPGVDVRHRTTFEERYRIPIVEASAMTETGGAAATTTSREPAGFGARCVGGDPEHGIGSLTILAPMSRLENRRVAGPRQRRRYQGRLLQRLPERRGSHRGGLAGDRFHTVDLVFADQDGLMYRFDRKKTIVRRSGEKIARARSRKRAYMDTRIGGCAVTPFPMTSAARRCSPSSCRVKRSTTPMRSRPRSSRPAPSASR